MFSNKDFGSPNTSKYVVEPTYQPPSELQVIGNTSMNTNFTVKHDIS